MSQPTQTLEGAIDEGTRETVGQTIVAHEHCPRCQGAVAHHNIQVIQSPHRYGDRSRLIVLFCPRCDCGFGLRQKMTPIGWMMMGMATLMRTGSTMRHLRRVHRQFTGE